MLGILLIRKTALRSIRKLFLQENTINAIAYHEQRKRATMPWPEQSKIRNSQQTPDLKLLFGLTALLYCSKCSNITLGCLGSRMPASKSAHIKHISHPSSRKQWRGMEPRVRDKRNTYSTHVISRFVDNDWSITEHACMHDAVARIFINNELNGWL